VSETLSETRDFWLSCGHHLLDRDAEGRLRITDAFLKAYLARPEITPPPEACAAERVLHERLLAAPRRPVRSEEVAAIADADARENWEVMLAFRNQLMHHATLEAGYLGIVRGIVVRAPGIMQGFLGGLKQVVGGNIEAYAEVCEAARRDAFERMLQHAAEVGADAVISMRYDATEFAEGITEVLAYGTAVKLTGESPAGS